MVEFLLVFEIMLVVVVVVFVVVVMNSRSNRNISLTSFTANTYLHACFGSHLNIRYRTGTLVLRR